MRHLKRRRPPGILAVLLALALVVQGVLGACLAGAAAASAASAELAACCSWTDGSGPGSSTGSDTNTGHPPKQATHHCREAPGLALPGAKSGGKAGAMPALVAGLWAAPDDPAALLIPPRDAPARSGPAIAVPSARAPPRAA